MNFIALDVETANSDLSSICQIGVAVFRNGVIANKWVSLVDPEDYFDSINESIHGITAEMVQGQPRFNQIVGQLHQFLSGQIVVSHSAFDRNAVRLVHKRYNIELPGITWLDSAKVVRRTWPQFSRSGYGLSSVCNFLRITFEHHDAGEDARAAGEILIRAIEESGISIDDWSIRSSQPIDPTATPVKITREGNPDGILSGEKIVFTGALSMPRHEAADLASRFGCEVLPGVSKKTTLLVVGDQDVARLNGKDKSSKHLKAEALIQEGVNIRILRESDFISLMHE